MQGILNTIQHGDCIAGMMGLPKGCIDLVFADPPFNIGYEYDVYDDAKEHREYLDWSRKWITQVHKILKPDGTFWLAIGDEYAAELKLLSQEIGFHCRSWVIWYYTFGVNCTKKFSRSHAHLFHFVKNPREFTFRSEELENRVPSARQLVYADSRANPRGRLPDDTWILRPQDLSDCFTSDEDTWYFPRVAGTFKERAGFHGCQMPEQLLGRIIRLCSHENEVVLDPFAGSATTLVVAKKLGRQFVGFELSADYHRRGTERLTTIRSGDLLNGAPEPLMSAPATPGRVSTKKQPVGFTTGTVRMESWPTYKNTSRRASEVSKGEFDRLVIKAFQCVHLGFSSDYITANKKLNEQFVEACHELGASLDPRDLNHRLLRLRKAGRLSVQTTRRYQIDRNDLDRFIFASEIAMRQMSNNGHSLDEVLCDPDLARDFDRMAESYAPGFSSLQYRWAALSVRKAFRSSLNAVREFDRTLLQPRPRLTFNLGELDRNLSRLPESSGLYIVESKAGESLFVGDTPNLEQRLSFQFQRAVFPKWEEYGLDVNIKCFEPIDEAKRIALRGRWLQKQHPQLNYFTCDEAKSAV